MLILPSDGAKDLRDETDFFFFLFFINYSEVSWIFSVFFVGCADCRWVFRDFQYTAFCRPEEKRKFVIHPFCVVWFINDAVGHLLFLTVNYAEERVRRITRRRLIVLQAARSGAPVTVVFFSSCVVYRLLVG